LYFYYIRIKVSGPANPPLTPGEHTAAAMAQQILDKTAVETPRVDAPPLAPSARSEPAPELTVILPTFNERANLPVIVGRLARALDGIDWEIIVVDDNSPDATSAAARELGAQDRRVRCIR